MDNEITYKHHVHREKRCHSCDHIIHLRYSCDNSCENDSSVEESFTTG